MSERESRGLGRRSSWEEYRDNISPVGVRVPDCDTTESAGARVRTDGNSSIP